MLVNRQKRMDLSNNKLPEYREGHNDADSDIPLPSIKSILSQCNRIPEKNLETVEKSKNIKKNAKIDNFFPCDGNFPDDTSCTICTIKYVGIDSNGDQIRYCHHHIRNYTGNVKMYLCGELYINRDSNTFDSRLLVCSGKDGKACFKNNLRYRHTGKFYCDNCKPEKSIPLRSDKTYLGVGDNYRLKKQDYFDLFPYDFLHDKFMIPFVDGYFLNSFTDFRKNNQPNNAMSRSKTNIPNILPSNNPPNIQQNNTINYCVTRPSNIVIKQNITVNHNNPSDDTKQVKKRKTKDKKSSYDDFIEEMSRFMTIIPIE